VILLAADIILTRSNTFLGRVIRLAERRPGDPAKYNHVGIVARSGLLRPEAREFWSGAAMVEALWHVRFGEVWDFYGPPAGPNRPIVAVYRPTNVPSNDRSAIAAAAEEHVGQRYGWWKLAAPLGDSMLSAVTPFRDVRLFRRLLFADSRPICSYLVAKAYASRGYDFGVPAGTATPDDVHDYVERELGRNYAKVFEGRIK
jgi:hypothetical protein